MTSQETPAVVESLDSAYEKIGHGNMQRMIAYVASISRNSGAFFAYCFAYLVLKQNYLCTSEVGGTNFSECSVEDICAARNLHGDQNLPFDYKVDTSYEYYLNNWYIEMDLMCKSNTQIGFMFT